MFWLYLIVSIIVLAASIVSARDNKKVAVFFSALFTGVVTGAMVFFFATMISAAIVGQHQEHTTTHQLARVGQEYVNGAFDSSSVVSWYQNDNGAIKLHSIDARDVSIKLTHDKPYVEYFQSKSNSHFWSVFNGAGDDTVVLHVPDASVP
jgi:hypothetical protein